jgi:hypothetical protein
MERYRARTSKKGTRRGEEYMADQQTLDEEAILRIVQDWPRGRQVHLAHLILDPGLATLDAQTGRPLISSAELRGIGAGDAPAPSDEDVERWRLEKYTK